MKHLIVMILTSCTLSCAEVQATPAQLKKAFINSIMVSVDPLFQKSYQETQHVYTRLKQYLNSLQLYTHMVARHHTAQAQEYCKTIREYCIMCITLYSIERSMRLPMHRVQLDALEKRLIALVQDAMAQSNGIYQNECQKTLSLQKVLAS